MEIATLVQDFVNESVEDSFDEVIKHKCAVFEEDFAEQGVTRRSEHTTFEGYLPDTSQDTNVVERDVLVCKILRLYVDDDLRMLEKRCDWFDEVFVKYDGIDSQIKLQGISVKEARHFLEYFSQIVGDTVLCKRFSREVFAGIFELYGSGIGEGRRYFARYHSPCGIKTIYALRDGGDVGNYRVEEKSRIGC